MRSHIFLGELLTSGPTKRRHRPNVLSSAPANSAVMHSTSCSVAITAWAQTGARQGPHFSNIWVNSALHPPGAAKSSTAALAIDGRGKNYR